MMRKFLTITIILILSQFLGHAEETGGKGSLHFRYGIEWGYSVSVINSYHYNYIHPVEGYRVDKKATDFYAYSNAYADLNAGVEFLKHFGTSLHAGFAGVKQARRMVPVSLRESYFFKNYGSDGVMAFLEEGVGFHKSEEELSYLAKAGAGYRISLSTRGCMDILISVEACTDHPSVYDNDIKAHVPSEYMRESDAVYGIMSFSIMLSF